MLMATYVATVAADRRRIGRALDEATAGTHRAEQVTDFMLGLFDESGAEQSLGDTVKARALLERGLALPESARQRPLFRLNQLSSARPPTPVVAELRNPDVARTTPDSLRFAIALKDISA